MTIAISPFLFVIADTLVILRLLPYSQKNPNANTVLKYDKEDSK